MSGHSKWSTIKRKKGANDAQRAKIFTKIAREIIVAVKAGGPDPDNNSSLKDAIAKARSNNMPNDNINRTIKKAAGDTDGDNYESITYEGYGPAGVAVIVNALTDNRNRTAADVRHAFDKNGGNMGQTGCVSFMFDQKGIIIIENEDMDEDEITMDEDFGHFRTFSKTGRTHVTAIGSLLISTVIQITMTVFGTKAGRVISIL